MSTSAEITNEEILQLVLENNLTITRLIDVVVKHNGIIGVGLITLGDQLKEYVNSKIEKHSAEYYLNT